MKPVCKIYESDKAMKKMMSFIGEVTMQKASGGSNAVVINPDVRDQSILGFGGVYTDTDVHMLLSMSQDKQNEAIKALFDKQSGAGWSFMRIPFGSTDWETTTDFYTYDDVPYGETDVNLDNFSIKRDIDRGLFDLCRRCKEVNPELKFLGSVWGVPGWMKENNSIMFGRFNPKYTKVYAKYLRKTVEAYQKEGIDLFAVTPQNESLTSDDRATPACRFTWRMQADVVKELRREFDEAGIKTEIWIFDHNYDLADQFVEPMLNDSETVKAINGVAMHDYGGSIDILADYYRKYPEMPFYLTERNVTSVPEMTRLVNELRAGAKSYIQWSVMSDNYGGPHQFLGNPFHYDRPLQPEHLAVLYNNRDNPDEWGTAKAYGIYGQFTKFIRPGMVRIDSTKGDEKWISNVAFIDDKNGDVTVVLVNQTENEQPLTIAVCGCQADFSVEANAVVTCVISGLDLSEHTDASVFTAPEFKKEPSWDLQPTEIIYKGEAKAGSEILFGCKVKNVGELPTPDGCLFVQYFLDGDCRIARSADLCKSLEPGESKTVWVNIPEGSKREWTAEQGYHTFFVWVQLGNCESEKNYDNNRCGAEFYFE
jgi:O-glycosyl hydrolase